MKRKKKQKITRSEKLGIMVAAINLTASIITLIAAKR